MLEVVGEELALGVIAGEASAVWVRSLVPNEQKSATSAISSARMHARGSSIIVPQRYSTEAPPRDALGQLAQPCELLAEADERMHDLDERQRAGALPTAAAARTIARTCIS